ncbi:MAG: hypothetical protein QM705_14895 [Ancrocorticia sp.]
MSGPITAQRSPAAPAIPSPAHEKTERGNILILGLTLWLVACLLVMGTISLTLVSLERRELLATADAVALEIADDIDDDAYYAGAAQAPPSSAHVRTRAAQLLDPGTRVSEPSGLVDGVVVVSLTREVSLMFVPSGLSDSRVTVNVTSSAGLRDR